MKKVGDLFAELGFRPDGSDAVKRAFVENLVKAAATSTPSVRFDRTRPVHAKKATSRPEKKQMFEGTSAEKPLDGQLSFDFESLDSEPPTPGGRRSVG